MERASEVFRPGAGAVRSAVLSIATVVLTLFAASTFAATGPRNVVVVANSRSSISKDIAAYYVEARKIPTSNICLIDCSTSEIISRAECENNILGPVQAFLEKPELSDHIDYIVLTKGVPLGADYGWSTGPLSLTNIMTCIEDPATAAFDNPYGPTVWDTVEVAFSHQLNLSGRHLYLVTRLDGATSDDIKMLIDRSLAPSPLGPFLLDAQPVTDILNVRLANARSVLLAKGIPVIYDNTTAFLGNYTGLMGYFSFGSNDPSFTRTAYLSNRFAPGSLADTFVSSSGRTFSPWTVGPSLIGELIAQGACGLNGYVSEPYQAYATYPEVLFDRYTKGYNMAESFYAATPLLWWKNVVVGDPLMAPYATAPVVTIQYPALPLTGLATVNAIVTDPEGISKVDFYFAGDLVGTCTSSPYSVQIDSTLYSVGQHDITVKATDAGPVSTEGLAQDTVDVWNPVSTLRQISDGFRHADGQLVVTLPKKVTAGTAEMGGSEFYIEESTRGSGIRVQSSVVVEEGDIVVVSGTMTTTAAERSIDATSVQIQQRATTPIPPIGITAHGIGGANASAYTKGITGGVGARNIGILIRTYGKTTYVGGENEDFFYIDNGSGMKDGSGRMGIRVNCRNLTKPPLGVRVLVTGISSCREIGGSIFPTIKLRRQSDVVIVN